MEFTNSQLIYIGGLAVLIVGIVAKQWFTKFVNQKFDDLHAYQAEGKKADRDHQAEDRQQFRFVFQFFRFHMFHSFFRL